MARKAKLGTGARARALKSKVVKQYMKKGMSKKRAEKIGGAVVGIQGRKKYGKTQMAKWSAAGRKRATKRGKK